MVLLTVMTFSTHLIMSPATASLMGFIDIRIGGGGGQNGILPMRIDLKQLIETASQLRRGHLGIVNWNRYRCKGDGDSLQNTSNNDH